MGQGMFHSNPNLIFKGLALPFLFPCYGTLCSTVRKPETLGCSISPQLLPLLLPPTDHSSFPWSSLAFPWSSSVPNPTCPLL